MASGRKRVRFALDINFTSAEARETFKARFNKVKDVLTPNSGPKLDNLSLMMALFNLVDMNDIAVSSSSSPPAQTTDQSLSVCPIYHREYY